MNNSVNCKNAWCIWLAMALHYDFHTHDMRPIRASVHCAVNESARHFVRSRSVYAVIHHSNTEENIEQMFLFWWRKKSHCANDSWDYYLWDAHKPYPLIHFIVKQIYLLRWKWSFSFHDAHSTEWIIFGAREEKSIRWVKWSQLSKAVLLSFLWKSADEHRKCSIVLKWLHFLKCVYLFYAQLFN